MKRIFHPLLLLLLVLIADRSGAVKTHEEAIVDEVLNADDPGEAAECMESMATHGALQPAGIFRRIRRGLNRLGRNIRRMLPRNWSVGVGPRPKPHPRPRPFP